MLNPKISNVRAHRTDSEKSENHDWKDLSRISRKNSNTNFRIMSGSTTPTNVPGGTLSDQNNSRNLLPERSSRYGRESISVKRDKNDKNDLRISRDGNDFRHLNHVK